jgi:aldose 1-epimerase
VARVLVQPAGNALSVITTLVRSADHAVPACFGWHPYFAPPERREAAWRLDGRALGDAHHDYGFAVPAGTHTTLNAVGWGFAVSLESGHRLVQVYASANRAVVCIEPMTAPTNALVTGRALPLVQPGSSYEARFRISVDPRV